ncbi:MAG: hypothetical protein U1E47_00050 [Rivihabitans pingtungensis]
MWGASLLCGLLAGSANFWLDRMGLAWLSWIAGGMLGMLPVLYAAQLTRTLNGYRPTLSTWPKAG